MQYGPRILENAHILGVNGFMVTISDEFNNSYSQFIPDSEARSLNFTSASFAVANLSGDLRIIEIEVETDVGNFSNNSTFLGKYLIFHAYST